MTISEIITSLESFAPLSYQETYDNAGLITGLSSWECTGVLVCLDSTEEVLTEAVQKNCNLVVAHHPVIFKGLKKIIPDNYISRALIIAIKNDIAIYAVHTNLDNVHNGVNGKIADRLGLENRSVLLPKQGVLKKLFTFAPVDNAAAVRDAIFRAGGGVISNYSECSFAAEGLGSFRAGEGSSPYAGKIAERHYERELKIEVIFPAYLEKVIVNAMKAAHPYEEVAYDVIPLTNDHPGVGSGLTGDLTEAMDEAAFMKLLQQKFNLSVLRHTPLLGKKVKKIGICGGAGSFLLSKALAAGVDFFITSDIKYHEFFEADGRLVVADIGHYESEHFTIDLVHEILTGNFNTFAVLKTEVNTNPVKYYKG